MQDPRIGAIKPPPPAGPEPKPEPPAHPGFKPPIIGQMVHFFPHRGHHTEWYFGPYTAFVIHMHPNDPRICHLFWIGPKGETGSYADIPHRSMQPGCYPTAGWQGHAMPPASHWAYPGEKDPEPR
jgi:hypothetical protein